MSLAHTRQSRPDSVLGFQVEVLQPYQVVLSSLGIGGVEGLPGASLHPVRFRVQSSEFRVQGSGFRDQGFWFRVQGSGFRVQGSGFRVQGSGFRVQGSGFRDQGFWFRVQGSGFRVQDSGFRVQGSGFRLDSVGLSGYPAIAAAVSACTSSHVRSCTGVPRS